METIYLDEALKRFEKKRSLWEQADNVLRRWAHENLLTSLCATPQTPPYHLEGKTVGDHLRRMLAGLFAVLDGTIPLSSLEEFARLKGFEEQIKKMEETIKEKAATFEVFTLVHDVGKFFRQQIEPNGRVRYFGHEKEIFQPVVLDLLRRLSEDYRLGDDEINHLVSLVSWHLEPLRRFFSGHEAKHVHLLEKLCQKAGLDPEPQLDLLQAAAFLDQTLGACPPCYVQVVNMISARHEHAPWKKEELVRRRAEERKRIERRIFRSVGLDGEAIMKLTRQSGSREFGNFLRTLQTAVRNEQLEDQTWPNELRQRIKLARQQLKEYDFFA